MPELSTPPGDTNGPDPTAQELAEILAELEFFLHLDEADALPLEEAAEESDE